MVKRSSLNAQPKATVLNHEAGFCKHLANCHQFNLAGSVGSVASRPFCLIQAAGLRRSKISGDLTMTAFVRTTLPQNRSLITISLNIR